MSDVRKDFNEARDTMRARFLEFEEKFIALHADYPEFYVAFWNHCDYLEALESVQMDLHDATTCEWDPEWDGHSEIEPPEFKFRAPSDMEDFCTYMSNYIHEGFNAEHGVNWEILKDAAADYLGENTRA
jgi:hypothetical protein